MADINSNTSLTDNKGYSSGVVSPPQRPDGKVGGRDGNTFDAWDPNLEQIQNAHDQQAAPTHAFEAAVVSNRVPIPPAPVADRDGVSDQTITADLGQLLIYPGEAIEQKPGTGAA